MENENNTLHTIDENNHFGVNLEDTNYIEEGSNSKYHSKCITRKATPEEIKYYEDLINKKNMKIL